MAIDGEALQVTRGREQRLFGRLHERADRHVRRAVEQDVQTRRRNSRLLVEHQNVGVQRGQFEHRLQYVLLGNAAGRVLGLRDVGDLTEEIHAGEVHVHGLPRDEQRGVGLLNVVHDLSRADGEVTFGERRVLLGHRSPQIALAAPRQILGQHEHVHVRVRWIERVDGPLPDGRFDHRRIERVLLRRPLACGFRLLAERSQFRIARQRVLYQRGQCDNRAVVVTGVLAVLAADVRQRLARGSGYRHCAHGGRQRENSCRYWSSHTSPQSRHRHATNEGAVKAERARQLTRASREVDVFRVGASREEGRSGAWSLAARTCRPSHPRGTTGMWVRPRHERRPRQPVRRAARRFRSR